MLENYFPKHKSWTEVENLLVTLTCFSNRLSNQQSLLKPAAKPSSQMEHFLKKTTSSQNVKSPLNSPPVTAPVTTNESIRSFTFSSSSYIPTQLSSSPAVVTSQVWSLNHL